MTELRAAIAESLGTRSFELWFGPQTRFEVVDRTLMIRVPNNFLHDWLRRNFRAQIDDCVRRFLGEGATSRFVVDADLGRASEREQAVRPDGAAESPNAPDAPDDAASLRETTRRQRRAGARPTTDRVDKVQVGEPHLLAHPTIATNRPPSRRAFARLGDFVVAASNRLAHTAAQLAVERPGEMSPLVIHGPTGVGKTHLLEGIWTAAHERRLPGGVVYLTAEQFTSFFLDALRGSGLPNFRRKYRGVGLLILDDIQFFAGKKATLVELLYTVNTLAEAGGQVVLAADRAPQELTELGDELVARLEGGMLCSIGAPELETRRGIAENLARRLEMAVPADVLDYVAEHVTTHSRALAGALNRLHASSLALARPIDVALAREALGEMILRARRPVQLPDVERAMCQVFELEPRALQSASKSKEVSHLRMLAMWLARKHTRAALSEIGSYFGRRSHATVLAAQQKVNDWMSRDEVVTSRKRSLNVAEAVRALEERLRTA